MARRPSSAHARRGGGSTLPAWLWLAIGMLLGLVLAALVIWAGLAPGLRDDRSPPQPVADSAAPEPAAAAPARQEFDFYTVLPEMEVLIPDSELRAQVRAEAPAATTGEAPATAVTTPPAQSALIYLLQAGSFRDPRPAEERKARLALLGMSARVETTNIDGTPYHRVYVGPFASAADVERAKQQLTDNGVDTIVMRRQQQ
ncbi:MAG: SPOR domain-containing protein [Xanthomonadales bacterium]|nr:SPOR domain-containing protein [Xanthomonadales bacterium]